MLRSFRSRFCEILGMFLDDQANTEIVPSKKELCLEKDGLPGLGFVGRNLECHEIVSKTLDFYNDSFNSISLKIIIIIRER